MSARLVKDINGIGGSSPREFISINGILYFAADGGPDQSSENGGGDNDNQSENSDDTSDSNDNGDQSNQSSSENSVGLWKSDGSSGGSVQLKSFESVSNLVEANDKLYFVAKTEGNFEIWSSDGTTGGTKRVNALNPGGDDFAAYNLFAIDDTLFFSASREEDSNGYELWRWEGDDVGTKLFKNLFPDRYITEQTTEDGELTITTEEFNPGTPGFSTDSFPGNFTSVDGGNFFFTAYSIEVPSTPPNFPDQTSIGGIELWFSDGTETGTYPIPINNQTYNIYNNLINFQNKERSGNN